MILSRRTLMTAAGGACAATTARADDGWVGADPAWHQAVLERFAGFGDKASGGAGDQASGAWLEAELRRLGYACHRQTFDVPFFAPRTTSLTSGPASAPLVYQAVSAPTGPRGLAGPLRLASTAGSLAGAIVLIPLPHKRWVTIVDPAAARPVADAFARGAAATVLVTNGPTGEAVALNAPVRRPPFERPVALLAPKDAAALLGAAAEGRPGEFVLDGTAGRRPAFNLVARIDRGAAKTLIITTPRSGWFGCAGERGPGLAIWLALAHWLPRAVRGLNLELVATSAHEYEFVGGEHYLEDLAPKPADTRLWVHIGASAAARDWHPMSPALRPLPSADSLRVLTATEDVIAQVRPAFAGLSGLEATYVASSATAGGELTNVLKAGYGSAIGLYGVHNYFHTRGDDMRCTSGELVRPVAQAFRAAIRASLGSQAEAAA